MSQIRMSYQEVRAVSSDIRSQAEKARQVMTTLQKSVNRLLPTWEGASRQAFQNTIVLYQKELNRVPELLDQISQTLAQTADRIQLAEEQAAADTSATIKTN